MFGQVYRTRRVPLVGAVAAAVLLASTGTALSGTAAAAAVTDPAGGPSDTRLIVRLAPGVGYDIDAAVTAAGGEVVAHQRALDTVVVTGPASLGGLLDDAPGVVTVSPDRQVTLQSYGGGHMFHDGGHDYNSWGQSDSWDDGSSDGNRDSSTWGQDSQAGQAPQPVTTNDVARFTGATSLWQRGITGAGVDVALIDTGVAPVSGLSHSLKVVVGPDLSFDSQSLDLRHLDGYGHGTAMAGIIAGRAVAPGNGRQYASDNTSAYGMAPDARLLSIKVADQNGAVDVSQIIAAIGWVAQYGKSFGLNVRVLNLSLGMDSKQDPRLDPLSWAAEVAWHKGIVVVASAGNSGEEVVGLTSPAYNPTIIAVGASDTRATSRPDDDVVPGWSTPGGGAVAPYRNPDVVAPGVAVVSLGVPGSVLQTAHPNARVGDRMRGSGTSQAAAVVSGGAALLLQQRPGLTPNQMKALLTSTARSLPRVARTAQGAGTIDLAAASYARTPTASAAPRFATGTGSLEAARGGHHLLDNDRVLTGEVDVWGKPWNLTGWTGNGSTFNGSVVAGPGFTADTVSVAGRSWAGRSWAGSTWSGRSWASLTFSGRSWAGKGWSSVL